VRVISGIRKGKLLSAPSGLNTRPTTDKVKEAVFDAIQYDVNGARALDLFAGSGQMGIEAISRGADSCVFIDKDQAALKAVTANVKACGFEDRSVILRKDSLVWLEQQPSKSFDLIFLDPPYEKGLLEQALKTINLFDILSSRGIIICESGAPFKPELSAPYAVKKRYRYGRIHVTTVIKQVTDENSDSSGEL
jgi:16S rRNA (guanine(966)-N(2))-methyltransferase RsmD